jgi:hypothetical protein
MRATWANEPLACDAARRMFAARRIGSDSDSAVTSPDHHGPDCPYSAAPSQSPL